MTTTLIILLAAVIAVGVSVLRKALHDDTETLIQIRKDLAALRYEDETLVQVLKGQEVLKATVETLVVDILDHIDINISKTNDRLDITQDGIGKANAVIIASLTKAHILAKEIAAANSTEMLEVVTAITTAFMTETIEIKAGIEVIVEVLSSAAAPEAAATSNADGPCNVKGCKKPAEVVTSWKMDILTPAEDVSVCEEHAQMMAQQAFQAPRTAKAAPQRVAGQRAPDDKCEHGIDMGDDYVWGQIHAHIDDNGKVIKHKVPDRESFAREHDIGEGTPDESVLTPAPLDDISAMIEAAYQAQKANIDAALDAKKK